MRRGFNYLAVLAASATVLTAAFCLTAITVAAQAPRGTQAVPRPARGVPAIPMLNGHPDLNGIWEAMTTANWDLLAHPMRPMVSQPGVYPDSLPVLAAPVVALGAAAGVPPGPGVVEGNEIPYKPKAALQKKENAEQWLDRDPELRCYMPGVPRAMYMPYPFQITQGTNKIMIAFEFNAASRTIHMNKVDPPPADTWMGFSEGHWEGNTLVVDSSDFNDLTWFSRSGDFHSDALHLVERITPMNANALRYEVTVEDPNVFTRPWKMSMVLYRRLEPNAQLMEYKCVQLVEETYLGDLRNKQLVRHWEGNTMIIDVKRKIPKGDKLYQRY
jgi:hypothetical protein